MSPGKNGKRHVRIIDLGIKDIPRRSFLSLKSYPPETFTFVTSFDLPDEKLFRRKNLGIHLAQIGTNYEIYLNGNLLKSEMYISPDGEIEKADQRDRSVRRKRQD